MATDIVVQKSLDAINAAVGANKIEGAKALAQFLNELIASDPSYGQKMSQSVRSNLTSTLNALKEATEQKPGPVVAKPKDCDGSVSCEARKAAVSSGQSAVERFLRASTRLGSTLSFAGSDREFAMYRMTEIIASTFLDPIWTTYRPSQNIDDEIESVRRHLAKRCPVLPKVVVICDADARGIEAWKKAELTNNTSLVFAFPKQGSVDVTFGKPSMQDKIELYRCKLECHPEVRRKSDQELETFLANRTFYEVDRGAARDIYDANAK